MTSGAFTEHADLTAWTVDPSEMSEPFQAMIGPAGVLRVPELDLSGYLECVQRCGDRFPGLR